MASIIKVFAIAAFFKDGAKQLQRGENAYNSGHVKKMMFSSEVQPAIIKGEVQASMKNKAYAVEVFNSVDKYSMYILDLSLLFSDLI